MYKLLLFAGTTEGRELAEYLAGCKVQVTACVATEYGETLISPQTNLTVHAGRMDRQQMQQLIQQEGFDLVIDATHRGGDAKYCRRLRPNRRPALPLSAGKRAGTG